MKDNVKICADADRRFLECYRHLNVADIHRPAAFDVELLGVEVMEFIDTLSVEVFCLNEEF